MLTFCNSDRLWIKEYRRVYPWLAEAMEYADGRCTEDTVIEGLLSHEYSLWTTPNAACVLQIVAVPGSDIRTLFVFLSGGDLQEIIASEPLIAQYGKAMGCSCMEISGRKGWERALKPLGWNYSSTNLVKKLEEVSDGFQS